MLFRKVSQRSLRKCRKPRGPWLGGECASELIGLVILRDGLFDCNISSNCAANLSVYCMTAMARGHTVVKSPVTHGARFGSTSVRQGSEVPWSAGRQARIVGVDGSWWRPRPELNRSTRFCRPLRNHSATWPHDT